LLANSNNNNPASERDGAGHAHDFLWRAFYARISRRRALVLCVFIYLFVTIARPRLPSFPLQQANDQEREREALAYEARLLGCQRASFDCYSGRNWSGPVLAVPRRAKFAQSEVERNEAQPLTLDHRLLRRRHRTDAIGAGSEPICFLQPAAIGPAAASDNLSPATNEAKLLV
jgi:hypothetical protein